MILNKYFKNKDYIELKKICFQEINRNNKIYKCKCKYYKY